MDYGSGEELRPLLTRKEAASLLNVGLRTFDRYVVESPIPKIVLSPRAVRFHRADIEALVERAS